MLRRTLVAASRSRALRRFAEDAPIARDVAARFVAGDTLQDAFDAIAVHNGAGRSVTLDHLGEDVTDAAAAREHADVVLAALDGIAARGLDASVSVKPTALGLDLDPDLCRELLDAICTRAAACGTHVTLDMEGSDHTDRTVGLVLDLRAAGHDDVGCAVQSYLHRTPADVAKLTAVGASLRLCKGAYAEPEEIAFQRREDVDRAYLELAEQLLTSGTFARFATHDHRLIRAIRDLARRHEVGDDDYEFQMLHGVREPLQRELTEAGLGVRVYVPFGTEWYPYFVRRLAERPANLLFFLRALAGGR
ncbi:MAG: proline dehydrogenase family protein [Actinomycetes bacterium]